MFQFEKRYTSWSWERLLRHILYWLAWLVFYAIINSTYNNDSFLYHAGIELQIMLIKLPFTYFVIYNLVPNWLIKKKYSIFLALFLGLAMAGGTLIWALYCFFIMPNSAEAQAGVFNSKLFYKALDLVYISSLPIILKLLQRSTYQEKMTLQLAQQRSEAELKLLKNQLHPHFLFNTLNNLYGMVLTNHPKAPEVITRLSDMMSYMLYECDRNEISLEKEIAHLENYIELEKIRYGSRLDVCFEKGGDTNGKTIAPLLLMPFVENAFKHGAAKNDKDPWICVNLWVSKDVLNFTVENNLENDKEINGNIFKTQSGIGLANVRKRLEMTYPGRHKLEIKQQDTYLSILNLSLYDEVPDSR
ncbi:MAG TPA: sensor histidine kinase [Chitinophagaceae bacterium]|nr:sensor histidine kinase [Chitinophagaceae bacterium]